ncbi:MAG: hypothetical protein JO300_07520 [Silvibacterium sp.]|nr:hypothetical protein [Silvibacterium sp.]MBV8437178.1 hypothetical protein [Silvibacterium sp.]
MSRVTRSNILPDYFSGMPMKRTVACILAICLGLSLSSPGAARADEASARAAAQKHNLKQSRRDMKRNRKELKKAQKPAAPKKSQEAAAILKAAATHLIIP